MISPLLANIYLHYVYDLWVRQWRKRNAHGDMIVVRYADDTVVGFMFERDARQFLADLVLRLEQFGLQLHLDKTQTIAFGRFALKWCRDQGRRPETFNFLGFTHICGVNRRGKFILRRHTMRERLGAKLREVRDALRRMMHMPIHEQGAYVKRVVNGWLNYFAVPTNNRAVNSFYRHVAWYWFRTLRRRSQRRTLNWAGMKRLTDRWLPPARLRHPLADMRFRVRTQGGSPVR